MNKNLIARAAFIGAAFLAAALPAQAIPITYALQDVSFDDGTVARGSFTYDADTGATSAWDITTADGLLSGFTYQEGGVFNNLFYTNSLLFYATGGSRYLNFTFEGPLTNAGGTYALLTNRTSYECDNCGTVRFINGGSVSSLSTDVPEPATALLMLPAALGLVAARRRAARSAS